MSGILYNFGAILGAFVFLAVCYKAIMQAVRYEQHGPAIYTSIRRDLGEDDTTASGYVEKSREAK